MHEDTMTPNRCQERDTDSVPTPARWWRIHVEAGHGTAELKDFLGKAFEVMDPDSPMALENFKAAWLALGGTEEE